MPGTKIRSSLLPKDAMNKNYSLRYWKDCFLGPISVMHTSKMSRIKAADIHPLTAASNSFFLPCFREHPLQRVCRDEKDVVQPACLEDWTPVQRQPCPSHNWQTDGCGLAYRKWRRNEDMPGLHGERQKQGSLLHIVHTGGRGYWVSAR